MKRTISIALLAGAFSASLFAQGMALPPGIAAEIKQVYSSVKTNVMGAANAMPEANYSFAPVPEEMTFGAWVAHVADSQTGICSTLNGQTKRGDAATKTSKAELVAALKASFDECDIAYNALTDANATELVAYGRGQNSRAGRLGYNSSHDQECYGSMAVYMRIKGVVPPSTAARTAGRGDRRAWDERARTLARIACFSDAGLRRRPGSKQAAHQHHLSQVVSVMVGNEQRFPQNCLTLTVRYPRVQVRRWITHQLAHGFEVGLKCLHALVPRHSVRRSLRFGPVSGGPFWRLVLRIPAEFEDVPLRQAHVLDDFPGRVLCAFRSFPTLP